MDQVCGVATTNSNNNKNLDTKITGICIKENCKTPSHQRVHPSVKFLPGWYLTKRNESRINHVHTYPRGDPSLATLHQEALLNTVCTDHVLAVTIFDHLESATTTDEGTRRTEKTFSPGVGKA